MKLALMPQPSSRTERTTQPFSWRVASSTRPLPDKDSFALSRRLVTTLAICSLSSASFGRGEKSFAITKSGSDSRPATASPIISFRSVSTGRVTSSLRRRLNRPMTWLIWATDVETILLAGGQLDPPPAGQGFLCVEQEVGYDLGDLLPVQRQFRQGRKVLCDHKVGFRLKAGHGIADHLVQIRLDRPGNQFAAQEAQSPDDMVDMGHRR